MATRRPINIPDFSQEVRPRAIATPTGAFVRPTADAQLTGLVEGLSAFQPSLQRFSAQFQRQTALEKQAEGVEAARKLVEEGLSLGEATRQGKLPQQDNPWFMAGFHEKMGANAADKWRIKLMEDMLKDADLQESTSTDDAVDFINKHRAEWLQDNAPGGRDQGFFEQGFGARSDAYTQEELMKFAARLEDKISKKSLNMHFADVKQHVEREYLKGTSPEEIAQGINILVQTQYSLGSKEKALDDTTIQAVVAAAMDMQEDAALAVLDGVFGSKQATELADTPAGATAIDKAREDIRNRRWIQQERDIATENRRRQEAVNEIMGDIIIAKAEDPNLDLKVFIPDLVKKAKNPEVVSRLSEFNRSVDSVVHRTNEDVRGELFTKIYIFDDPGDQTTEEDVAMARFNKQLTTEDAASLVAAIRAARESGRDADQGIWGDFQFKTELGNMEGRFQKVFGQYENPVAAEKAARAQAEFMHRWRLLNSEGGISPEKKGPWLSETAEEIIKRIGGEEMMKGLTDKRRGPAPQFDLPNVEKKLPQDLVVPKQDILDYGQGQGASPALQQKFDELGLKTQAEKKVFIKNQLKAIIVNGTKNPAGAEPDDKKEE